MSFCKEMRKATREIHALSDALVNAKLLFALPSNKVWAEGLLIFYEIFRFLEEAMKRHTGENLGRFLVDGMERTAAFEEDLKYYLTEDWKLAYNVRDEVADYLLHLQNIESRDPDLLIAYVYHLYLGLLSGGQILTKKRQIKDRIFNQTSKEGYAITNFREIKVFDLKKSIKDTLEELAGEWSEEKRQLLLDESRKVFEWNNKIIKTVQGTNRVLFETALQILGFLVFLYLIFNFFFFK